MVSANQTVNKINNWVYVTGVIRSGTTFIGQMLSLPIQVDYIHEPFNPLCGMPDIDGWYRYIRPNLATDSSDAEYHKSVKKIFDYSLTLKSYYPKTDPWQRQLVKQVVGSRGPFYLRLAKLNPFHQAAIIKDPTGNLLTEYLYHNFQVKPVIVVKHPLSFIASLKRVGWWPQVSWITDDQPHLVEDYFKDELDFVHRSYDSLLEGSAAYWRATYKVLLDQASKYPDWQVITHEELSQNSVIVFKRLYEKLNLPWSERVEKKIVKLTQSDNHSTDAKQGLVQDFNRNSKDIFQMRRNSLSIKERQAIFNIVKDVSQKIYSTKSFDID